MEPPVKDWTYAVYMNGNNDLETLVGKNIKYELAPTGSNDHVNVVCLAQLNTLQTWTGAKYFYITPGFVPSDATAIDWGHKEELDMGDPTTFKLFIEYTKKLYPAKNYCITLWGHGYTFVPGYTMHGPTSNSKLTITHIRNILIDAGGINILSFDTCVGVSIENVCEFSGCAEVLIGNSTYTGMRGINHALAIDTLHQHPNICTHDLAIVIQQSMKEAATAAYSLCPRYIKSIMESINTLGEALMSNLDLMTTVHTHCVNIDSDMCDLSSLCRSIQTILNVPAINIHCDILLSQLQVAMISSCPKREFKGCDDICIYVPQSKKIFEAYDPMYYKEILQFGQHCPHWTQMIELYCATK